MEFFRILGQRQIYIKANLTSFRISDIADVERAFQSSSYNICTYI